VLPLVKGAGGFSLNVTLSLSKGDPDMWLSRFDKLSMTDFGFDRKKIEEESPQPLFTRGVNLLRRFAG
jgi:hypothetical protein